jgi:hypothetical protein
MLKLSLIMFHSFELQLKIQTFDVRDKITVLSQREGYAKNK